MRQFLSVVFLSCLNFFVHILVAVGTGCSSAASFFHGYWIQLASKYDNKYVSRDVTIVVDDGDRPTPTANVPSVSSKMSN